MYTTDYNDAALAALGATGAIIYVVIAIAISVVFLIGEWKTFEKAGEHGWASIIPFYNTYVLFKISWGQGWLFLLLLIPIVNLVIMIITMVKLGQAFGKSGGFNIGLVLLSSIFICILGFGESRYVGVPQN